MKLPGSGEPAAANLTAGFLLATVITRHASEPERHSNSLTLALAPRIIQINAKNLPATPLVSVNRTAIANGLGDATMEITGSPDILPEQAAVLLLGDRSVPAESHPAKTNKLKFIAKKIEAGTYRLRLRVDGVDSHLIDRTSPDKPKFDDSLQVVINERTGLANCECTVSSRRAGMAAAEIGTLYPTEIGGGCACNTRNPGSGISALLLPRPLPLHPGSSCLHPLHPIKACPVHFRPPANQMIKASIHTTDNWRNYKPTFDFAASLEPPPALVLLGRQLGLSVFERDILLLCAALELDTRVAGLCAQAQDNQNRAYPTFALALSLFDDPAWEALSPDRPLRYWRLIEINQPGAQPLTTSAISCG